MPCKIIIVGKNSSIDDSTVMARSEDGITFNPKKFVVIHPSLQPKIYQPYSSNLTINLWLCRSKYFNYNNDSN